MSLIPLGIALEITAAGLGTLSKQLIAYAEHRHSRVLNALGVLVNVLVGPVVDASAYAFAPQTVIAPFASLDVIFNALSAPYTLRFQHEQVTRYHLCAALLVTGGASLSAFFGNVDITSDHPHQTLRFILYLSCEVVLMVVVISMLKAGRLPRKVKGVALGMVAGCLMGNVFFLKKFVGIIQTLIDSNAVDKFKVLSTPEPYVLLGAAAVCSILGTIFMQRGLREYKGVFMVTIFEGSHIFTACLSGDVVLCEMAHAPWLQYVLYWLSVSLIVCGIVLMNWSSKDSELHSSMTGAGFSSVMESLRKQSNETLTVAVTIDELAEPSSFEQETSKVLVGEVPVSHSAP